MRILLVVEDPLLDQHIAKPIVERLVGLAHGQHEVRIMQDPRFRGDTDALDRERISEVLAKWSWRTDVFVLLVDRDCNRCGVTEARIIARQEEAQRAGFALIGQCAIQELEVWLLAAFQDQLGVSWKDVRAECDPKERFFDGLVEQLGIGSTGPSRGRKELMQSAIGKLKTIRSRCKEVDHLGRRLVRFLEEKTLDTSVHDYSTEGR